MIRRTVIVLSTCLCVLVVLAWARSRQTYDLLTFLSRADTYWVFASHAGGFELSSTTHFNSHPLTWDPVSSTPTSGGWSYASVRYLPLDSAGEQTGPPGHQIDPLTQVSPGLEIANEHSFAGFRYVSQVERISYRNAAAISRSYLAVGIPFWLVAILSLAPVVLLGIRPAIRRRRRLRNNRCASCGYDLRGSPGTCPECGAPRTPALPAR